ncbi:MAG: class I SAM-dependent methyltransferase [Planctomycetaceae bacterium]|nr:class I SAM-dependent methyltransferase [Planctomycetaceae bacterium]MBV8383305.1 class I SAM-dependent methyltransferase [Planctomycetaceae bacterium]MBV8555998.1 class I SAM-dependent methyltransferase [Planctomycetaceae bacterium]MBV8607931.1 class I SAM-dependent methyltransferase [Singulisphaera sp.]
MADQPRTAAEYPLSYSEREQRRLVAQSRFCGDLTERLFRAAGLLPGMSILDVGCGVGDVSLLAAAIVGPSGSVLGVDRAAASIEAARGRARAAGLENVAFEEGDLDLPSLDPGRTFDALVGRFVLMYLTDPAATLAHLLRFLRPGGVVVFQEVEMSLARSVPPVRLFETCMGWIRETFRRAGSEIDMGSRLFSTYQRVDLPRPEMHLEGRVDGGAGAAAYDLIAQMVHSLLPMMERLGVATSSEVGVETLAARLEAETCGGGGVVMLSPLIGAWARKPG